MKEVAARLKVNPGLVYALVKRGELKCVRVSNAIRVPASALEEFIARRSIT